MPFIDLHAFDKAISELRTFLAECPDAFTSRDDLDRFREGVAMRRVAVLEAVHPELRPEQLGRTLRPGESPGLPFPSADAPPEQHDRLKAIWEWMERFELPTLLALDRHARAELRRLVDGTPTLGTVWYHGGRSYSPDGKTPLLVTREQHDFLQAFLDNPGQALSTELLGKCVNNPSRVARDLGERFPGAVRLPAHRGDGYFVCVCPVENEVAKRI
jgi:hypothetical protein